jgi:multidrug resistance protein, MATE family
LMLNCLWMGAVALVCLAVPQVLLRLFMPDNVTESLQFLALAVVMLRVSMAWQLFDAIAMALSEALRAAGDTLFPLVARLTIAWLIFVPGAYLSVRVFHLGAVTATLWLVAYLVLLAAALVWRFQRGHWQTLGLIERTDGQPPH